ADRNRSHWSTSKTPSYTKSVSWQHHHYFGHNTGHAIGIEVHEDPRFSPRDTTTLQPGMLLTVEPGIYLPGQGGVRIEDVVLVTPQGAEVLYAMPKTVLLTGEA
ncbi:M24 family metallopeptidase, partial [Escherichia coli]|uniref:M24 family metallopeptidase n=1 Tax=Escherichia coli TaxID=562 RepID=UPI00211A5BF8